MQNTSISLPLYSLIGISLRTSNADPNVMQDIGTHWQRFYSEKIMDKIPNKADGNGAGVATSILALYTDYEGDFMKPYSLILGCRVSSIDDVPNGMIAKSIPAMNYSLFTAKGKMPDCIMQTWQQIWKSDIKRAYKFDFEVYGEKSHNPENAEVEIYISVK